MSKKRKDPAARKKREQRIKDRKKSADRNFRCMLGLDDDPKVNGFRRNRAPDHMIYKPVDPKQDEDEDDKPVPDEAFQS